MHNLSESNRGLRLPVVTLLCFTSAFLGLNPAVAQSPTPDQPQYEPAISCHVAPMVGYYGGSPEDPYAQYGGFGIEFKGPSCSAIIPVHADDPQMPGRQGILIGSVSAGCYDDDVNSLQTGPKLIAEIEVDKVEVTESPGRSGAGSGLYDTCTGYSVTTTPIIK